MDYKFQLKKVDRIYFFSTIEAHNENSTCFYTEF